MKKLSREGWNLIKQTFDASLREHGMGNGYIILCEPEEYREEVRVKIDGLVLPYHKVAIIGKLTERAATQYELALNQEHSVELTRKIVEATLQCP